MTQTEWPSAEVIDPPIRELVWALNRLHGFRSFSSCGGHCIQTNLSQQPYGHWAVNFTLARTASGWNTMALLVRVAQDTGSTCAPWFDGGLKFELCGQCVPQQFIDALKT